MENLLSFDMDVYSRSHHYDKHNDTEKCPYASLPFNPSPTKLTKDDNYWSAFCRYRLICIFCSFTLSVMLQYIPSLVCLFTQHYYFESSMLLHVLLVHSISYWVVVPFMDNPSSDSWFPKNVSHSLGCCFLTFAVQRQFNLLFVLLVSYAENHCQSQCWGTSSLRSFF